MAGMVKIKGNLTQIVSLWNNYRLSVPKHITLKAKTESRAQNTKVNSKSYGKLTVLYLICRNMIIIQVSLLIGSVAKFMLHVCTQPQKISSYLDFTKIIRFY